MRRCLLSSLIWVLAELSATNTLAAIVPELDLTSLCDRADLVVVGRVILIVRENSFLIRKSQTRRIVLKGGNCPETDKENVALLPMVARLYH